MRKIKKIILFSYGNSNKASSWSNIPYLMRKSLEEKGIEIVSCNLLPNRYFKKIINTVIRADKFYDYVRPSIVRWGNNLRIKSIVEKHPDADFCLFLNYDYYNKFNDIPSLLFHDWTYEMFFERNNHEPTKRERKFIHYQDSVIEKADLVVTLFSEARDYMQNKYRNNITRIDRNVVNLLDKSPLDIEAVIRQKFNSDYILFIGREHYREGLEHLINALSLLDRKLKLKVIGMTGSNNDMVEYYGWLKKDVDQQNKIYYDLIRGAKICVNTTPAWAGYSSIIEAMFYATPVIVYPFNQFTGEFGTELDCGFYSTGEKYDLAEKIKTILSLSFQDYSRLAMNARRLVEDYTWENYTDDLIKLMETSGNIPLK